MTDFQSILEHDLGRIGPATFTLDDVIRRRDRTRRNQRIAAGVVGIAVFVVAVWLVTSGGAFDRSTPAAPGGSEMVPTQTAPPAAPASAAPEGGETGPPRHGRPHRIGADSSYPMGLSLGNPPFPPGTEVARGAPQRLDWVAKLPWGSSIRSSRAIRGERRPWTGPTKRRAPILRKGWSTP
jgi:hypothetical protein